LHDAEVALGKTGKLATFERDALVQSAYPDHFHLFTPGSRLAIRTAEPNSLHRHEVILMVDASRLKSRLSIPGVRSGPAELSPGADGDGRPPVRRTVSRGAMRGSLPGKPTRQDIRASGQYTCGGPRAAQSGGRVADPVNVRATGFTSIPSTVCAGVAMILPSESHRPISCSVYLASGHHGVRAEFLRRLFTGSHRVG